MKSEEFVVNVEQGGYFEYWLAVFFCRHSLHVCGEPDYDIVAVTVKLYQLTLWNICCLQIYQALRILTNMLKSLKFRFYLDKEEDTVNGMQFRLFSSIAYLF